MADRFLFLVNNRFAVLIHDRTETASQFGHKQWLAAKSRNASLSRLVLNIGPIVCRKHDNRSIVSGFLAYSSYYLYSVYIGKQPVYYINIVIVVAHKSLTGTKHSFFSRQSPLRSHAYLLEHIGNAVAGIKIVVNNKSA